MELYEIKNGLEKARLLLEELFVSIDINALNREIEGLTVQTMDEHFWDDQDHAKKIYDQLNEMKKTADTYDHLKDLFNELNETYDYVKETEDQDFKEALDQDYEKFEKELAEFEKTLLFSGEYDHHNVILEIHPGAGGTESQDWASMLMRMYQRYGDKKGWKVEVLDYLDGEEAGLKSVTIRFVGYNAYGHLKAEKGVHRLVRISPFDSSKRRHTSFASVEITPEIDKTINIEINDKDLKIDIYRSSGPGGQGVNTTDSAVRVTHLPTGIVITCQNERSQIQNKEHCLEILKSKLYALELEKKNKEIMDMKKGQMANAFGSGKRSYVMCPYTRVVDNDSNYETSRVEDVLNGDLEDFIIAGLRK